MRWKPTLAAFALTFAGRFLAPTPTTVAGAVGYDGSQPKAHMSRRGYPRLIACDPSGTYAPAAKDPAQRPRVRPTISDAMRDPPGRRASLLTFGYQLMAKSYIRP